MKPLHRQILIFVLLVVLFYFLLREVFKVANLSIKDTKPFQYKGGANKKKDWYNYITPLAKVIGRQYGIPWQAISVQTALETGWGESSLLRKYNNFGGSKSRPGEASVNFGTQEFINGKWVTITDGFQVFKTPYKGLIGYAEFFHKNPRYATALKFPNDPYRFITEIRNAGYATSPNYISILHGMLKNDLKS